MPWPATSPAQGSVENLAPRSRASQQLFSIYAEVHSRHSGPGGQVAGFEVQDDVVFAATGGVVPRPGIAFSLFEKQWNVSGAESGVFGNRLRLGWLGRTCQAYTVTRMAS